MNPRITSMENLIASDPGGRNVFGLVISDQLRLAAQSLRLARRVGIVSGFFIRAAGAGETDGPPGAYALGNALERLGIGVDYLTDEPNAPLLTSLGHTPLTDATGYLDRAGPTHLISIERCGRGRDGRYRNMRGEDITDSTAPLDQLFLAAPGRSITTIGIGDGGNEIGMGKVFAAALETVPHGREIASVVPTDFCIASGVSNWGAYGLVGALSVLTGKDLLPTPAEAVATVETLVREGGAVDGRTHRREPTVDGLPLSASLRILEDIRSLVAPSPLGRGSPLCVGIIGYGETGRAAASLLASRGHRVRVSDQNPDCKGGEETSKRQNVETSKQRVEKSKSQKVEIEPRRDPVEPSRDPVEPSRDRKGAVASSTFQRASPAILSAAENLQGAARPNSDPQQLGGIPNPAIEAFETGRHTIEFFAGCDLVIASPGVRADTPIRDELHTRGIPIMSELEMAYQLCNRPIIAVTGTVGKRTTVELIRRLFRTAGHALDIGGNKGLPLSAILAEKVEKSKSQKVEIERGGAPGAESPVSTFRLFDFSSLAPVALAVSSFQLETVVHFRPDIAVILNINEAHLDRHRSIAEYIRIKSRVFMNQRPDDVLIVPYDDDRLRPLARKHHGRTFFISTGHEVERGAWLDGDRVRINVDGPIEEVPLDRLPPCPYPEDLLSAVLSARLSNVRPS